MLSKGALRIITRGGDGVSEIAGLADGSLIYVVLSVLKFVYRIVDQDLELLLPAVVQLVEARVALNTVLGQSRNEILTGFCIFLSLNAGGFSCLSPILLCFFILNLSRWVGTENSWGAQYFVKVLELLSRALLV